jgi:hypothetical protein
MSTHWFRWCSRSNSQYSVGALTAKFPLVTRGAEQVTERSGKKSWVHWRWQCPTFVRQTFVEWAGKTINKSFWAGAYYRQQREESDINK